MPEVNLDTQAGGNAPAITLRELLTYAGRYCAVAFESRELLGIGDTWPEAFKDACSKGHQERSFYEYRVPKTVVAKQTTVEGSGESKFHSA